MFIMEFQTALIFCNMFTIDERKRYQLTADQLNQKL